MTNTQKATLRRIARDVKKLQEEADHVLIELDEYVHDNQDTLDGTERGERLDGQIDELFELQTTFSVLFDEIIHASLA